MSMWPSLWSQLDHRHIRTTQPPAVHFPEHGLDSARCRILFLDSDRQRCKGTSHRSVRLLVRRHVPSFLHIMPTDDYGLAFYSPGEGPVPFTYSAEVFPLTHREMGM